MKRRQSSRPFRKGDENSFGESPRRRKMKPKGKNKYRPERAFDYQEEPEEELDLFADFYDEEPDIDEVV